MSSEDKKASEKRLEEGLGSLRGCLVEGDAEQLRGERRVRRRALAISIALQSAVLATLILVRRSLEKERISLTLVTPIPPYSAYHSATHNSAAPPQRQRGPKNPCRICPPTNIPLTIVMRDPAATASQTDDAPTGIGDTIPGAIDGAIPLMDPRQRVVPPSNAEHHPTRPQIVRVTTIDPAMLIHRVEPLYPPLARQTRREGRVELRAMIGTDGNIQSLQVVAGDPMFLQSAMEAVRQWHYKPAYLNGQAVEIDTYITVVYVLQH